MPTQRPALSWPIQMRLCAEIEQARHVGPVGPRLHDAGCVLQRGEDLVEGGRNITEDNVLLPEVVLQSIHQLMSLQQVSSLHMPSKQSLQLHRTFLKRGIALSQGFNRQL